ncbi:MAG: SgcJ/EcaC family oxidoreductase [Acidobacteriota bacterium]|nr:SgcJ/EcaC family oxidoreductase [Acidobacteriota bacterium]
MLRNSTILILVLFVASVNGYGQKTDSKAKDEAMIRANVKQLTKGWNMKSGAEFAKPFAEDSDYVVINGIHIKGRAANAEAHQRIFDTIYKDSSLVATVKQIRFLRPDVAVVHGVSNLTFKINGEEKKGNSFVTLVMTKEKGKWSIAAFQNTAIQPQGEK